eukprot:CAMPEP_0197664782 /NCGR_PEP_ID=MMETSP1338-20131121/58849_1 /TAXON_ID=43686 ORGANISM="Pelagodinium beii, Strain RCC1491" /NCGR_SAMPLE_ID=MMETSP1338 /ASSEMBLY_ACC=CAM_ASM_000754 /LENGTH=67 /DNA_ID=CAMNT_0043243493 /DNA_START=151 /DNA_END=354 /DNA_ORIENTATION=+
MTPRMPIELCYQAGGVPLRLLAGSRRIAEPRSVRYQTRLLRRSNQRTLCALPSHTAWSAADDAVIVY